MLEYPILGFAPDLPPDTQGVLVASSGILPTRKGVGNGVSLSSRSLPITDGPSLGGARLMALDGITPRDFIGTAARIYELVSGVATVLRGAQAATETDTWSFAQFGSVSLAINHANKLQASTSPGAVFADAASAAPKGSIVITPGLPTTQFAMVFDYDDGTNAFGDGIFWSALSDYTDWTPSIATECGNIRIIDLNGKFTAAIPFRDGVVAFKARSMYLGVYVGGAAVWDWTRISSDIGCIGKNAVCVANDVLYFADEFGLWMFDGSYPKPMPGFVHKYWADQLSASSFNRNFVRLVFDKSAHLIWAGYGGSATTTNKFLVFNVLSQLWTNYGLISDPSGPALAELYDPGHGSQSGITTQFMALNKNTAPTGSFQLAAHGQTYGITTFKGLRLQFSVGPSDTATGWLSGILYRGPSLRNVTIFNVAMTFSAPGKLDVLCSDRFVAPAVNFTAGTNWECTKVAVNLSYSPAGE